MKKILTILFICILCFSCIFLQGYAQEEVYESITKGEFLSTLVDMMGWQMEHNNKEEMTIQEYVKIANKHGLMIGDQENFHDVITKKEARLMFVRSMGYDPAVGKINFLEHPFENIQIDANNSAQKIIISMYEKISNPIEELHGFYAIKSYPQIEMLPYFDSIGFGWSRVEVDHQNRVQLKTDAGNSFYLPTGFSEVIEKSCENHVSSNLMVYASQYNKDQDGIGIIEHIFKNEKEKESIIKQIVDNVNHMQKKEEADGFEGVIIDFEDIAKESLAKDFNDFLRNLKKELDKSNKKLYVTVPPKKYYKGYDYKTIGEIADKVILMAHDYYPRKANQLATGDSKEGLYHKQSPLTPIENTYNENFDIYHALKDITDEKTGIANKNKIYLQISFDAVQWRKGEKDGVWKVTPPYDAIKERIKKDRRDLDFYMWYDKKSENPYFNYYDEAKGIENIIWYEDTRSVLSKINLAKLFGVKNISIWRLGNIPAYGKVDEQFMYLDAWQHIINQHRKVK